MKKIKIATIKSDKIQRKYQFPAIAQELIKQNKAKLIKCVMNMHGR
jgi:hypothetical protein